MLTTLPTFCTSRGVLDLNSSSLVGTRKTRTTTSMAENSTVCFYGPMSTFNSMVGLQLLNTIVRPQLPNTMVGPELLNNMVGPQMNLFQNPLNFQPISSRHDVIHTPASFPVWGLLWQSPVSYPLRTSVNCTNWLHIWTLNQNSSKPNQTEI